jgi:hypothetical protein
MRQVFGDEVEREAIRLAKQSSGHFVILYERAGPGFEGLVAVPRNFRDATLCV